ncbi:uncharacterized protein LOC131677029 [Topomyia yanbarensis]|uniref:uncharacterized protein LOC131677029 n=1 Tax=Topomyia yanbarensis TaxID=2498891 RepID=UPI00273C3A4E|nr:uncharacterized protein LOC131677029 [Topomyia yanbarensis]
MGSLTRGLLIEIKSDIKNKTSLLAKNEEMTDAIYNAHWYLMKKPEQNSFLIMLHKSQNFIEMTVGGFAPLNITTFVAIMNRIYSYFTMMIGVLE